VSTRECGKRRYENWIVSNGQVTTDIRCPMEPGFIFRFLLQGVSSVVPVMSPREPGKLLDQSEDRAWSRIAPGAARDEMLPGAE